MECELKVPAKLMENELMDCFTICVKNELMDCPTKLLANCCWNNKERIGDVRTDGFLQRTECLKDESELLGVAQDLQVGG